jgi:hypothetical protein
LVFVGIDLRCPTPTLSCSAQSIEMGGASFYASETGKIDIGGAQSAEDMALALAHEVIHAKYDKEGQRANISIDTRADYVGKMVEEEAAGVVGSIEVKRDLQAAGRTVTATSPLEAEYAAAYKKALDELKESKPSANSAALDAAGKAAGLEAVRNGFKTGKVVTADTNERYPDYCGKAWDKEHTARKGEAPTVGQ